MEECYLNPPTLPKVTFRYGCFYFFKIVQMVQNRAKHHMFLRPGRCVELYKHLRWSLLQTRHLAVS